MCGCDIESPEVFNEKRRRARKQHKCCECRRPILPGETYEYVSGIWDGRPSSFKTCLVCVDLRDRINSEVECACLAFTSLYEDASEYGYLSFA